MSSPSYSPHSPTNHCNLLNFSGPAGTLTGASSAQSVSPISAETNDMDLKQLERMQAFHSLPTAWPPIPQLSDTMLPEESVFRRTMLQPSLDTARRCTYAWTAQLDSQLETHSITNPLCPTERLKHFSHAMWNNRLESNMQPPPDCTKSRNHPRRQTEKPAQFVPQHSRELPHSVSVSLDAQQWEAMRALPFRSQLWPSLERSGTGVDPH